ncbi:MAG: efflux RND transporter periplasmic adaptor subunit [Desulfobacter sp.]|nr:MAG: efflux RND transporter periplasmic adaptor subunit [Desulfobacter sp.]
MKTEKIKKWILFCLAAPACALGAVSLYAMKPDRQVQIKGEIPLKQVSYVKAAPGDYPARIKTFGEVAPKWTTTLRAQVGGRIIRINKDLEPGHRLASGDLLLEIDGTDYRAALAQAKLELENASVHLIQAERKAAQARADWQGAGITQAPSSPLVFHGPQLKAARARVTSARESVAKAQKDLDRTRITAPYGGLVVQRFADKGETLFPGDQVATLVSAGEVEIRVSLDQAQINGLGRWQNARSTLMDPATGRAWQGKLVRDGGRVDPNTRLCNFFIRAEDPDKTLRPGMFVTAVISGSSPARLLALPESALTREGDIWIIDKEDRLRRRPARPAFYEAGRVFVESQFIKTGPSRMRVAALPAPSFIAGTKVSPQLLKKGS